MTHLWKCGNCGVMVPIDMMGYIGPKDRASERCDPLMEFVQLCNRCVDKNPGLGIARAVCDDTLQREPGLSN